MTVPKTPQFETRTRSRPVTAPTHEDLERKEVEDMQKYVSIFYNKNIEKIMCIQ
jgi:hypothetical protein